jgi:RNA polymerase sigma-B factor
MTVTAIRSQGHDDLRPRNALVERHLPFAFSLARRYARSSEMAEDLKQVAALALVKAVDRYDPDRGTSFTTFAKPTILGELKRHLRDNRWAVHVPREMQELAQSVARETDQLTAVLRRSPTTREVADSLGVTRERVVEARSALNGLDAASLDSPFCVDPDGEDIVADRLGKEDEGFELVEDRNAVALALAQLPIRQRVALRLRFGDDMTQREIGEILGVSQMQVSRMLRRSLSDLRGAANAVAA